MQSVEVDDFGHFLKQTCQTALLQQAQQKAQAFLDDHPQQPADVVTRCTNSTSLHLAVSSSLLSVWVVSLCVQDMKGSSNEGASILLRKSKTDQMGAGKWIRLSMEATQAVLDWLEAAKIEDGFVLRGIDPSYRITAQLVREPGSKDF